MTYADPYHECVTVYNHNMKDFDRAVSDKLNDPMFHDCHFSISFPAHDSAYIAHIIFTGDGDV